jgi:hypothetical protein
MTYNFKNSLKCEFFLASKEKINDLRLIGGKKIEFLTFLGFFTAVSY